MHVLGLGQVGRLVPAAPGVVEIGHGSLRGAVLVAERATGAEFLAERATRMGSVDLAASHPRGDDPVPADRPAHVTAGPSFLPGDADAEAVHGPVTVQAGLALCQIGRASCRER